MKGNLLSGEIVLIAYILSLHYSKRVFLMSPVSAKAMCIL